MEQSQNKVKLNSHERGWKVVGFMLMLIPNDIAVARVNLPKLFDANVERHQKDNTVVIGTPVLIGSTISNVSEHVIVTMVLIVKMLR